jgi:hypothetical protein
MQELQASGQGSNSVAGMHWPALWVCSMFGGQPLPMLLGSPCKGSFLTATLLTSLHLSPVCAAQFGADFHDLSRLADLATSLTSGDAAALQAVLEQLSVPDRCGVCGCGCLCARAW